MARPVRVDVWSDLACPWCYVGKKRLDKAVAQLPGKQVDVRWHPFIIDPNTNPAGEEYLAYNKRRWGSDAWTESLKACGRPDGAHFSDWRWWPATLNAHRLVQLAEQGGKAHEAKERLFRAAYEEGQNISDLDTLTRIGAELVLPQVMEFLKSSAGTAEVRQADTRAKREHNIHGVPYFVVSAPGGAQRVLEGAQTSTALLSALRSAAECSAV